jgi:hypothetical protein
MMIHQDGSRHEWAAGKMWDLIVTMDDATNEHYSMFFVEEEGTVSSMRAFNYPHFSYKIYLVLLIFQHEEFD